MSLKGKTLFITGASRGIGLAIALKAAADGANIAIAAKTVEPHPKLEGTIHTAAALIAKAGGGALPLQSTCATRLPSRRRSRRPRRNSAASTSWSTMPAPFRSRRSAQTDMQRYDLMQQINTRGTFMVSKYAMPYLAKAANPHILMLSPPLDMQEKWFAPHTAYSIAKFGMSLVVLGLAGELRGKGSRSTRCGRAPPSPPPRSRTCSAATPSCACRARRRSWRMRPIASSTSRQELHRQFPDRRHLPGRRRRHRFRPIPRRSEPAAAGGFLRARQDPATAGRESEG